MSRLKDYSLKSQLLNSASAMAISGLFVAGLPAHAQDGQEADDDDTVRLEEIFVTATKRAESVQDVAQSIKAFSTADIERQGILDMADVASALPSISLSSTRAGLNELVYRGISSGNSWRLDSQVAVYLDDQPMTASTTQLDPRMVDIQRVESLPGPQGTLFGSSSQTGTLRFITNKPDFDGFAGQVNAEVKFTKGGEESYDINGWLNIPVNDDFAIRVNAYDVKEGGYIDNVYSTSPHGFGGTPDNAGLEEENFNDYDITGARLLASWNVNDDWNVLATIMHQESTTTGVWESDTAIGDYKVARFSEEWRTDKWTSYALTIKGDLGFAEFSNSFAYVDREQAYQFDNTHYEAWHTSYYTYWADYYNAYYGTDYHYYDLFVTNYNGGVYRSLQDARRYSNELRITSTTESRFKWMVGAFYEDNIDGWEDKGDIPDYTNSRSWAYAQQQACEHNANGYTYIQCPLADPGDTWYIDILDRSTKQFALFGEVSYDFTEALTATVGARWFKYDRTEITERYWPPGLPIYDAVIDGFGAQAIEEGNESNKALKLGLEYKIDDDRMVYAIFSQGFRLGGRNNAKAVRINFVPEKFSPDKLDNYEVGMKTEWLDNRLQINASLFYMKWKDIQLSISSDDKWWLRGKINGGGGRNYGAELDFTAAVTENLRLEGSFYIGDPIFTDDAVTSEGVTELVAGTSMIDAARKKFSLSADYTIPDVFSDVDMFMRYDFRYMGALYSNLDAAADGVYNVDSYKMSNLQIGFETENDLTATIMVRNLFDARANTFTGNGDTFYAEYWGHTGFGETHNLARPRTISFKIMKKF